MPTIHREGSYKFRFYSLENNEPPHIHVWSTTGQMKIWLNADLEVEECYGIKKIKLPEFYLSPSWMEKNIRDNCQK